MGWERCRETSQSGGPRDSALLLRKTATARNLRFLPFWAKNAPLGHFLNAQTLTGFESPTLLIAENPGVSPDFQQAEGEGFEPPVVSHNGFQDRHIRPLCQPSGRFWRGIDFSRCAVCFRFFADFWQRRWIFAKVKSPGDVAERPKAAPC